jgi:hypothetical protein
VPVAPRSRFYAQKNPNQLRGFVRPALAGASVQIQKENASGGWTSVAATKVDANGDFSATVALSPGSYRARVTGMTGFVAGTTPVLRVIGP